MAARSFLRQALSTQKNWLFKCHKSSNNHNLWLKTYGRSSLQLPITACCSCSTSQQLSSSGLKQASHFVVSANNVAYKLPGERLTGAILDPIFQTSGVWCPPGTASVQIVPPAHHIQKVEPTENVPAKIVMPYLVRIRHKKMKKHKLKKLRKRMIFVNRKLTHKKNVKKEKLMQQYEKQWYKLAEDFNAEEHVKEQLDLAKQGGWSVDIMADFKKKKTS